MYQRYSRLPASGPARATRNRAPRRALQGRGEEPRLAFWRTSAGVEVDLIVEADGRLVPVEVKASGTPRPGMAAGIQALRRDLGEAAAPGYVVHTGEVTLPLAPGVTALPFGAF